MKTGSKQIWHHWELLVWLGCKWDALISSPTTANDNLLASLCTLSPPPPCFSTALACPSHLLISPAAAPGGFWMWSLPAAPMISCYYFCVCGLLVTKMTGKKRIWSVASQDPALLPMSDSSKQAVLTEKLNFPSSMNLLWTILTFLKIKIRRLLLGISKR